MLASAPVRALAERRAIAAAAGLLCAAAVFLSAGLALSRLVWIGTAALLLAAIAVVGSPRIGGAAAAFLALLGGLAVWFGLTTLWSASPDSSWIYTNRTLVYVAFALLGVLVAGTPERVADGAAVVLAALFGWALLAKCVPALYSDYGRVARLRAPLDYWNELALYAVVAVPLALRLRRRVAGAVLLYGAVLTLLLTYSRFGIALACLAAVAWLVLERVGRAESVLVAALAAAGGAASFGVALALAGITNDGQPRSVRAHDGWIFALAVIGIGTAVAAAASRIRVQESLRPRIERLAAIAGAVGAVVVVALAIAFAGRIWHAFANPVSSQIGSGSGHLASFSSSNRWRWWQEAWHAFVRHPGGGTGAGTFELTDRMLRASPLTTTEPHNVPLQFLSESGIVGLLLFLAAAGAAALGIVRARRSPAVTALAIAVAAFAVHLVADTDWDYLATCGPLLLLAGALLARPAGTESPRRALLGAVAVAFALAAVYSLAAPWLAQRQLSTLSLSSLKRAHSYDPLSTEVLTDWAALEDAVGNTLRAGRLYHDAVTLEPQNANTWFALGDFYRYHGAKLLAYRAYDRSWHDDRFGPAGAPCGALDQMRHAVFGVWPASCPGGRPRATP
jgi:O-antigen ligase/polysaccharide polymerase Wzy-like membrane protein